MKRIAVLNVLFGLGLVSLGFAGQRGGAGQQAPRIIEVEKFKDNVFLHYGFAQKILELYRPSGCRRGHRSCEKIKRIGEMRID